MKLIWTTAALGLTASVSAQEGYVVKCVTGLHLVVARASGEAAGFGVLGKVKDQILAQVPNSDAVWVPYPATITNPVYIESEPDGVGNMTALIKAYGDGCPGSKMAVLGYSQGAHVIGDTLIGPQYNSTFSAFGNGTSLNQTYIDNIVAVIMMGDPANVNGQPGRPFNVGNSTRNGFFPRLDYSRWNTTGLFNKTQSYCDAQDTFCDSGTLGNASLIIHESYIQEYGTQATNYVVSKAALAGLSANTTNSSSTSSSSTTGTSSATTTGAGATSTGSTTASASASSSSASTTSGAMKIATNLSDYLTAGVLGSLLMCLI